MGRNGTGVRAISGSSIEVTFTYKGVRCRERIRLEPTPANLKAAANFLGAVRTAIANGTFDYRVSFPDSKRIAQFVERQGDALLVRSFLDTWLGRQENVLAASTIEGYRKIIKGILKPAFGHLVLSDVRRSHVREWASKQKFSNKRMTNVLSVLRAALAEAVQDEIVETNVLYGWTYQRNEAPSRDDDVDPFTADEQAAILGATVGQERNLFQFAFWTGLRTSELIALQWSDIDWERGIVRVQRARTRAARVAKKVEDTKTRGSRRNVKLLEPALAALNDQKRFSLLLGGPIFRNPRTGEAWSGDNVIWLAWNRAIEKSAARYRRPYQTRHTYASMMLSAGEPPMWVASQMGHISLKMIEQRYGRWIKDAAPDAGRRAEALFGGAVADAQTAADGSGGNG
ncbi:site-specific integrase [Burkholderia thailandensis]|uniref:site-specific integrase n=1 Tax=Burkholderia thailandensis TaxID=57975 RepID=UPI00107EC991|nr:site-specific integrase [Burkholderia thailandensis]TGB34870.1 site-specific integrase [Burkholderia thailandensis]